MSRKTQRVVLKSQAREIISKVYDFMKKEASNNYAEKITDARWRTAQAVGVSESTVTRILSERKAHAMSTLNVIEPSSAHGKGPSPSCAMKPGMHATHASTPLTIKPSPALTIKPSTAHTLEPSAMLMVEGSFESGNEETTSHSNMVYSSTGIFTSPMRRRKVGPRKINLEEVDIAIVRKTIQDYHKEHDRYPTLSWLKNDLKERIQFNGCKTTLRTLLHKLGYKWKRTETKSRKVV